MDIAALNTWLRDNLEGFTYLANILTVTTVVFAVVSGWVAIRQWREQSAETRRVAQEDQRRLETELELRAVEHAQWLLTEVDSAVVEARAANKASANSGVRALISKGEMTARLTRLDAKALIEERGIDPHGAAAEVKANADKYGRVLNMLEVFAAKVSNSTYDQDKVYRYCAVYFCETFEDWAPLVAIYRRTTDTEFFTDGWDLYQRWSARLEEEHRRPTYT